MLNSIQFLRAIASWIVVGHHFVQVFFGLNPNGPLEKLFADYGALGVDLFFVISGFVIYISTVDKSITPLLFIYNRLVRIVPAYYFFSLLTAVILYFVGDVISSTKLEFPFLIKSLLFIPALNPSGAGYYPLVTPGWSLNLEMVFYGIFSVILAFNKKYRVALLGVGISLLYWVIPRFGGVFSFYFNNIVFEFVMGVLIGCLYRAKILDKISTTVAVGSGLSAIIFVYAMKSGHHWFFVGVPFVVLICSLLSQERYFGRLPVIGLLGEWSFSVYLSHVIVISLAFKIYSYYEISLLVVLAITIILVIIVSMASYYFIEKKVSAILKK